VSPQNTPLSDLEGNLPIVMLAVRVRPETLGRIA
jgi:hypothetical protein